MTSSGDAEQRQALLGDEGWSQVEAPPPKEGPSVQELIRQNPDTVIHTLQATGVQQAAQFQLPDKLVLRSLGDEKVVTMGHSQADIDFEATWRRQLSGAQRSSRSSWGRWGTAAIGGSDDWCCSVPVNAYVVSIRDAAAPAHRGLLRPLIRRWQAGGCAAATFQLPAVQAVINWKWSFAAKLLVAELGLFLIWMTSFFIFALAYRDSDVQLSLPQLLATRRGLVAVVAEVVGFASMLPFVYAEACAAAAYGAGFLDIWRVLDLATYLLQALTVVLHLSRLSIGAQIIPVAAAVQCPLLLFRLQFFSRVFPATRFAFVDDLKEVLHDMKWYLAFLVLVMAGFAAAFVVLFRPNAAGEGEEEFAGLGHAFITMVSWVAGDPNLTLLYRRHVAHPVAACVLGLVYIFVFTLVLMTLLVGLMTNTLAKVTKDEEVRLLLSKALIIDELESTVPSLLRRLWPQMHPRYVHVLRVDPDRLDAVKLDRLWKSLSDEDAERLAQQPAGRSQMPAGPAATGAATPASNQPQQARAGSGSGGGGGHTRQQSLAAMSVPESAPGEPPPSVRWRGSLLDAYLGTAGPPFHEGSPSTDALAYQQALLGGEEAEALSDAAAAVAVSSSEFQELREEVRELKQLLLKMLPGDGGSGHSNAGLAGAGGAIGSGGSSALSAAGSGKEKSVSFST